MDDATKAANLVANLRSRPPWMGGVVLEVGERDLLLAHLDGEPHRLAAAREESARGVDRGDGASPIQKGAEGTLSRECALPMVEVLP